MGGATGAWALEASGHVLATYAVSSAQIIDRL